MGRKTTAPLALRPIHAHLSPVMISAAQLALSQIVSPPFRGLLWKSVGLTLGLLAALWIIIQAVILQFLVLPFGWMETAFSIASGFGLLIGMAFLIAPVTTLFAGLFLDG